MSTVAPETTAERIRTWLLKVFRQAEFLAKQKLLQRRCPVCSSEDSSFYANNDYLDYVRCNHCSLVYMNPTIDPEMVNEGFQGGDDLLDEYFDIVAKDKAQVPPAQKPNPENDAKLKDIYNIKKTGKLLDVGCSFGDFLHKATFFYDVEGAEINPRTAAYAEKYFTVHKNYLANLGLKKEYDIVTLHQILYGVPDPIELLGDIHKVLKDDGILYINTPNADSYAMELFGGKANHLYGYTSQNVFNKKSLSVLAKKTGFAIETFRTEWLDIYLDDLIVFMDDKDQFIHKKNTQVPEYLTNLNLEEKAQHESARDLGCRGNYLVAVLKKI